MTNIEKLAMGEKADCTDASCLPPVLQELTVSGCNVLLKKFEHIRIIGPRELANKTREALNANGFIVTRSGPYSDVDMFPTVDSTRFLFMAEREV